MLKQMFKNFASKLRRTVKEPEPSPEALLNGVIAANRQHSGSAIPPLRIPQKSSLRRKTGNVYDAYLGATFSHFGENARRQRAMARSRK